MTRHFDAVILGGGPAGATAACNLARTSASVLIVEEKATPEFKIGETVPGIGRAQFARAGLGDLLATVPRLRCSGNRSAWGSDQLQVRSSLLDPYGGSSHIDRLEFDEALLDRAVGAGAELLRGARARAWVRRHGGWQVTLPPPDGTIHCDGIIDCTGRPAVFARTQGARRIAIDRQVALVALLSASTDPDLSITIEAAEFGWWYSAQVPGAKRIVALFSDIDLLSGFDVKSPGGFAALIGATRHISALTQDPAMSAAAPAIVLADTAYLTASAGDGWCAAGDAAASLDPLASMGIMNAVKSGFDTAQFAMTGFSGHQSYSDAVMERAMTHARQRVAYYRLEARWPSSAFWARRQGERADLRESDRMKG